MYITAVAVVILLLNILVALPVRGRKIDSPKPEGVVARPYQCDEHGREV